MAVSGINCEISQQGQLEHPWQDHVLHTLQFKISYFEQELHLLDLAACMGKTD